MAKELLGSVLEIEVDNPGPELVSSEEIQPGRQAAVRDVGCSMSRFLSRTLAPSLTLGTVRTREN